MTSIPAPKNPTIAVIGDGQLARMMQPAAIELGIHLKLLAGSADSAAAQVIPDQVLGDYRNLATLEEVATGVQAITFDHEHVPTEALESLQEQGVSVQPNPAALVHAQDKLIMRKKLRELGCPVPPFAVIESYEDAQAFWGAVKEVCVKACRGGYDGHGVWFPETVEEFWNIVAQQREHGVQCLAEEKVNLVRELSAMVARTPSGATQSWQVVESVQKDGICAEAIAPAPHTSATVQARAQELAIFIAEELDVTGVLAVELFETLDANGQPEIIVNELAMRPHNTGHWTQDGCMTSQFEQHVRAVLDWPLGSTAPKAPYTVMVNVLGGKQEPELSVAERIREINTRYPEAKIHWYAKDYRAGRKLGHINMCGSDPQRVLQAAQAAAGFLRDGVWQ